MSKLGFGLGFVFGGILGAMAATALAGDAQRREQLRERGIELRLRADAELANLRNRAQELRQPLQRAVSESVEVARRTRQELGQRFVRLGTDSPPPSGTSPRETPPAP